MNMRPVAEVRITEEEASDDSVECLCLESFTRVPFPQVAEDCEDDDEERGPQQPTRIASHSEEVPACSTFTCW